MDIHDYSESIQVLGVIKSNAGNESSLTLTVTYPKYDPTTIKVQGILTDPERHPLIFGIPGWRGPLEVWGQLPWGAVLRLDEPWITHMRGIEVELGCSGFSFGIETPIDFQGRSSVSVHIPYTELVDTDTAEVPSYLGTIGSERKSGDGIKWSSTVGEACAADYYHFEPRFGRGQVLTRIKLAEIRYSGETISNLSPTSLVKQIDQGLDEPLLLLSFLSRKHLPWYEIRCTFLPADSKKQSVQEFLRRRLTFVRSTQNASPLLQQGQLREGKFQRLLDHFREHPFKAWLRRAMIYIAASYHEATVESMASAVYMSLEAMAAGHAENQGRSCLLAAQDQLELLTHIREAIREFGATRRLDAQIVEQVLSNLQGLDRTSLKRRTLDLIRDTQIGTDDLWPEGTKLADGTQSMIHRRNKFIHEAFVEEPPWPLLKDLDRIRAIVERSILAELGWDPAQVSPLAYKHALLREVE